MKACKLRSSNQNILIGTRHVITGSLELISTLEKKVVGHIHPEQDSVPITTQFRPRRRLSPNSDLDSDFHPISTSTPISTQFWPRHRPRPWFRRLKYLEYNKFRARKNSDLDLISKNPDGVSILRPGSRQERLEFETPFTSQTGTNQIKKELNKLIERIGERSLVIYDCRKAKEHLFRTKSSIGLDLIFKWSSIKEFIQFIWRIQNITSSFLSAIINLLEITISFEAFCTNETVLYGKTFEILYRVDQ